MECGEISLGEGLFGDSEEHLDWAKEVVKALCRVWTRPVEIHTIVDEKETALRFDGRDYSQKSL